MLSEKKQPDIVEALYKAGLNLMAEQQSCF
jgi:hypothetical protein